MVAVVQVTSEIIEDVRKSKWNYKCPLSHAMPETCLGKRRDIFLTFSAPGVPRATQFKSITNLLIKIFQPKREDTGKEKNLIMKRWQCNEYSKFESETHGEHVGWLMPVASQDRHKIGQLWKLAMSWSCVSTRTKTNSFIFAHDSEIIISNWHVNCCGGIPPT